MKVAVLGPIAKDYVTIDGRRSIQIGGIPYYVALALQALGTEEVAPYVSCGPEDRNWVQDNFSGLNLKFLSARKTIESYISYSASDPDTRDSNIKSYPNTIEAETRLLQELEKFDHIILGPLFHDDISFELFERLKHKLLAMDNFGLFTYNENGRMIRKNPENLHRVLPFLNYLFLDKSEAFFASGYENIKEAGRFLQAKGLANMIITEGSQGSHLFVGPDYYKIPSFPPRQIADTTGAGDTYMAAFIRATELFDDPDEQGRFAAMVATMSLENKGAFRENLEKVLERLGQMRGLNF